MPPWQSLKTRSAIKRESYIMSSISIIIPVLNEQDRIYQSLLQLQHNSDIEVIVVDGGSQDKTVQIAQRFGVKVIISSQPGRANQMNDGAVAASGEILLFLHVDTFLPAGYKQHVSNILSNPQTVVGAFELAIDSHQLSLRLIERLVNLRSRFFSFPYGDQAFFLKASVFREVGGFADLPIMEDFEFIQRLKRIGKIVIAPAKVLTSARRWQELGVLKTTLINQLIVMGYYLGVSPEKLAKWYYDLND